MKVFLQSIFLQLLLTPYIGYRGYQALPAKRSYRWPFVGLLVLELIVFLFGYLFIKELPAQVQVGRYHSWVVDNEGLPDCLEVTSVSEEGQIMSLRHKQYDVRGIQYHPESVLTPEGRKIIANWLKH